MPNPTTGILDDCLRANEDPLSNGGLWNGTVTGGAPCRLVTNRIRAEVVAGTGTSTSIWGSNFNSDQEAFATLGTLAITADRGITVCTRLVDSVAWNGYALEAFIAIPPLATGASLPLLHVESRTTLNGYMRIRRFDNGVATSLTDDVALVSASGDRIWLKSEGSTHTMYYAVGAADFEEMGSVDDATYSGASPIACRNRGQTASLYNFGGGSL